MRRTKNEPLKKNKCDVQKCTAVVRRTKNELLKKTRQAHRHISVFLKRATHASPRLREAAYALEDINEHRASELRELYAKYIDLLAEIENIEADLHTKKDILSMPKHLLDDRLDFLRKYNARMYEHYQRLLAEIDHELMGWE
ncbi:MAG: hypothetical protein ACXQT3_01880 [Methermicoccaceae archaeon]